MSGTLEVMVYAPADGLPCLKPMFGSTPCSSSGVEESRSSVNDVPKNEKLTKKQGELLDGEAAADERGGESNITPKPSPQGILEEALGLGRKDLGEQDQSVPRSNFAEDMGGDYSTKGQGSDEHIYFDEGPQAIDAAESTSNDNGGDSSDPPESVSWPHEPRYCADVWQQGGNQDDGTATRFVWVFPLATPRASPRALFV